MMIMVGEIIPKHEARPRSYARRNGDFWCGWAGLLLEAVRPLKWTRVVDSDKASTKIERSFGGPS